MPLEIWGGPRVVAQFEKHAPSAAKAAIDSSTYGAAQAAPFQKHSKLSTNWPRRGITPEINAV